MAMTKLMLLAIFLASASSTPIINRRSPDDEPLSFNPGGPMIPVPTDDQTTAPATLILPTGTDSLGGPLIPEPRFPGGDITPDPAISAEEPSPDPMVTGGAMLPPKVRDVRLSVNPGGPIILPPSATATGIQLPSGIIPGGPMKPPKRDDPLSFNPGGPMIPASAPSSVVTSSPTLVLPPGPKGCTTTISETAVSPCSWNGIQTVYPSTTTMSKEVDCHGCLNVYVHKDIYFCPMFVIDSVTTASVPSTSWRTVCAPSTPLIPLTYTAVPVTAQPPAVTPSAAPGPAKPPRDLAAPDACPTTYVVQPPQSAGKTLTQYQRTVTATVRLNCGGCPLVISTALAGYGPAGRFTTTVTSPVHTTTAYICA